MRVRSAYLLLFLLAGCWESTYFAIKLAVFTMSPEMVTLGRMVIAAVAFTLLMKAQCHRWPTDGRVWALFAVLAALGNVLPNYLISWAEVRVESGLAAILIAVMPLMTLVLAHVATRDERLTRTRLLGVVLGFFGIVVLIGPASLRGLGADLGAQLALLGAAAGFAANAVIARRLPDLPLSVTAAGVTVAGTVLIFPVAVATGSTAAAPSMSSLAATAWLGLVGTAAMLLLYFAIVRSAGATFVALANFLAPPMALLLGVLFLAETPSLQSLAALVLILAGVFVAGGRPRLGTRADQD